MVTENIIFCAPATYFLHKSTKNYNSLKNTCSLVWWPTFLFNYTPCHRNNSEKFQKNSFHKNGYALFHKHLRTHFPLSNTLILAGLSAAHSPCVETHCMTTNFIFVHMLDTGLDITTAYIKPFTKK